MTERDPYSALTSGKHSGYDRCAARDGIFTAVDEKRLGW